MVVWFHTRGGKRRRSQTVVNDSWKSNFMAPEISLTASQIQGFLVPDTGIANCRRNGRFLWVVMYPTWDGGTPRKKRKVGTEEGRNSHGGSDLK